MPDQYNAPPKKSTKNKYTHLIENRSGNLPDVDGSESYFVEKVSMKSFIKAASLRGICLAVYFCIRRRIRMEKESEVVFPYKTVRETKVSDETIRRAITKLECAGMIRVRRAIGKSPRIRVLE